MEGIGEIINKLQINRSTISQNTVDKFDSYGNKIECQKCDDSTWIPVTDGNDHVTFKRCECYATKKAKALWTSFGIKPEDVKKIADYKPYDDITTQAKQKAVDYIRNYDSIAQNRENSFGLFGQPGGGKTHLVVGIGAALLNRDTNPIATVYMPYIEVMRELKANVLDEETYNKVLWKYQRAKLLIIDDLFKDKVKKGRLTGELNEADMKHIYPIINHRYINKLPTLISSECTPNMLLDLDDALAGRILESCGNNIVVFGNSHNYRMRKFA